MRLHPAREWGLMKTVGIVLAGGLSSRYGSPKAFAKWNGFYFYELAMNVLAPYCDEVVIVTRPELAGKFDHTLRVVTDLAEVAGEGPLAGILSGMDAVDADRYIILPCDMPFMTSEVIARLVERHESAVTAVVQEGKLHPLVSVWSGKAKVELLSALESGQRKVMKVQEKLGVKWIEGITLSDNPQHVLKNVNTPDILRGVDLDESDCR